MARPPSDIPERILQAARQRFLQHGVDGASLRQIARDAGTNIGMVYYYYKTKDELFLATIEDNYAAFVRDLAIALSPEAPVHERLHKLYARFARLSEDDYHVLSLVLREALISSERMLRIAARFQTGHLPLALALVEDGMRDGSLRTDVHPLALMAATFVLGLFPQIAHRRIQDAQLPIARALPSPEQAAEALLEVVLHGVAGS
jgi:TetR/AcrR family transcriptional regulator